MVLAALAFPAGAAAARNSRLNDKIQNRPYADLRRWHLGFSIGMHTEDLRFTHNGLIFSLRLSPGMYFGSRDITMRELGSGAVERQNIKSTFVVLPLDLKFAAQRYRNSRPYILTGVMPAFDVSKKRSDFLRMNTTDFYVSVGFGCDFYLPYFKLIPEVKFCFGLTDVLTHERPDLADDPNKFKFTQSIAKATSKMIVLTFYFE